MKTKEAVILFFYLSFEIINSYSQNVIFSSKQNFLTDEYALNNPDSVYMISIDSGFVNFFDYNFSDFKNLNKIEYYNNSKDTIYFPDNLYNITNLKILKLEGAFFPLSSNISNLKNIEDIEIISSLKYNILPKEIIELKHLKYITIYGIDSIIPEICKLDSLEFLILYGDFYKLPKNIGNLKQLKCLRFMSPNLKKLPKSFAKLNIQELLIEFWQGNFVPKEICHLKQLKKLYIIFGESLKFCPNCLKKLDKIEVIVIDNFFSNKLKKRIKKWFSKKNIEIYI